MKLRLPHAPYIANKIARDLAASDALNVHGGLDNAAAIAQKEIEEDIRKEMALEARVLEILDENEDEIEFMRLDERQLFYMAKKKMAAEYGVILNWDDRYNELSHKILNELIDESIIDFEVSDNIVKNIIFKAIEGYIRSFEQIEETVLEKLNNYKRKLIQGTEEYDIVFQKLYEEELAKKGFL